MTLRSVGILILFVLACTFGCQKDDEPQPEPGGTDQETAREQERTPEGFERIESGVFITDQPVRIEQYIEYLNATGRDMPAWLESPVIDYQDPVTGLDKDEAEKLAHFHLLRLPDKTEWEQASDVVRGEPYPWGEDSEDDSVIYFIRDWTSADSGKKKAIQRREKLLDEVEQVHRDKIHELSQDLEELEKQVGEEVRERWNDFKTDLSELVQAEKEHARAAARTKGRETILAILRRIGDEKKKIIHAKYKDDAEENSVEEAKKEYADYLKEQRNNLQQLSTQVVETNEDLSEQTRQYMKQIEEKATGLIDRIANASTAYVKQAEKVDEAETLGVLRQRLERELNTLTELADKMKKDLQETQKELANAADELNEQREDVRDATSIKEEIDDVRTRIKGLNDDIDTTFEQEPHLFSDLEEYSKLAATKQALEKELSMLKEVLDMFESGNIEDQETHQSSPEESGEQDE